jgi:hypothetical protein
MSDGDSGQRQLRHTAIISSKEARKKAFGDALNAGRRFSVVGDRIQQKRSEAEQEHQKLVQRQQWLNQNAVLEKESRLAAKGVNAAWGRAITRMGGSVCARPACVDIAAIETMTLSDGDVGEQLSRLQSDMAQSLEQHSNERAALVGIVSDVLNSASPKNPVASSHHDAITHNDWNSESPREEENLPAILLLQLRQDLANEEAGLRKARRDLEIESDDVESRIVSLTNAYKEVCCQSSNSVYQHEGNVSSQEELPDSVHKAREHLKSARAETLQLMKEEKCAEETVRNAQQRMLQESNELLVKKRVSQRHAKSNEATILHKQKREREAEKRKMMETVLQQKKDSDAHERLKQNKTRYTIITHLCRCAISLIALRALPHISSLESFSFLLYC